MLGEGREGIEDVEGGVPRGVDACGDGRATGGVDFRAGGGDMNGFGAFMIIEGEFGGKIVGDADLPEEAGAGDGLDGLRGWFGGKSGECGEERENGEVAFFHGDGGDLIQFESM